MSEPIRINRDELNDPKVDEVLSREAIYRGSWDDGGDGEEVGKVKRRGGGRGQGKGLYVQAVLITGLLALFGALLGWGLVEPYYHDDLTEDCVVCQRPADPGDQAVCDDCGDVHHQGCWRLGGEYEDAEGGTQRSKQPHTCAGCGKSVLRKQSLFADFFMVPLIVGLAACMIGMTDGLMSRAWTRALTGGGVGLAVGVIGGLVMSFVANIGYGFGQVAIILFGAKMANVPLEDIGGLDMPFWATVGNMSIRSAAWCVFGLATGLAPGLLQRSRDLVTVGVLGGVIGGFLGGLFFDPIAILAGGGEVSRAVGFGFMGLTTGLGIGLVEQLSKDAWLYMEEGPLVGKQFVLYKDPTKIGSSPKCDIFVFKDPDISPEHAYLRRVGAAHEVESVGGAPVLVNGKRVGQQRLEDGDQIRVGKACFRYYVRKKKKKQIR